MPTRASIEGLQKVSDDISRASIWQILEVMVLSALAPLSLGFHAPMTAVAPASRAAVRMQVGYVAPTAPGARPPPARSRIMIGVKTA